MDLNEFSTPLPNGITIHHLELHNLSVRENRPIIEFEYTGDQDDDFTLTVFGPERAGLLADLTDYLESSTLNVKQANIYTFPNGAVMDQFTLSDPHHLLHDDDMLTQIHDTLVKMIASNENEGRQSRRHNQTNNTSSSTPTDSQYNYALLGHRVPISLLAPRGRARPGLPRRICSNIALTEMEEEHRIEMERARRKSEARTANFADHAISSSLIDGDYLYHYASDTRYRHRFRLSEDKRYLCWGDSHAVKLSHYAGVLFGPKSAVFQDLGPRLVDPEWLCFSLVSNPSDTSTPISNRDHAETIDLVCVSVDQLNRWMLGLQALCNPDNKQLLHRLTLDDVTRMRVIYKIRAHAHTRGLTVRRYILKRVKEEGEKRISIDVNRQIADEVNHLEAELANLQKKLIDSARRETLLSTALRDFQTSWEVDITEVELIQPIGQGAFSEMWKGTWRSTPVAVKSLITRGIGGISSTPDMNHQHYPQNTQKGSNQNDKEFNGNASMESAKISTEDRKLLHDFHLEVTMLNKLRHPNIVLFLGACTVLPQLCILTEFCHGGSLFAALRKRSWRASLTLQDLRHVARHIGRGMQYLHASRIIHRDLKSHNILLDRHVEEGCPVVKIADFGLSRNFYGLGTVTGSANGIMTSETGTYRWMAPEMIRHEAYNEKVDVYSYGVVLWELFSCEIPFAGMTPIQAAFAVADKHLRPKCESAHAKEVKIPAAWKALIERCWHRSSHARPRFHEILFILDEMESCPDGSIPNALRTKTREPHFRAEFNKTHDIRIPHYTVKEQSAYGQIVFNSSDHLEEALQTESNPKQTGLGHSGSAPNLQKLL